MKLHHLAPVLGAFALAAVGATPPAQAAAGGGRMLQTFSCGGQDVTIAVSSGNDGDNWGAGRVVDGGALIPVSLEYLVLDDTADLVLDDEIVQHGGPAPLPTAEGHVRGERARWCARRDRSAGLRPARRCRAHRHRHVLAPGDGSASALIGRSEHDRIWWGRLPSHGNRLRRAPAGASSGRERMTACPNA
jgi:hypothetical protein